jgi:hypothetical protein
LQQQQQQQQQLAQEGGGQESSQHVFLADDKRGNIKDWHINLTFFLCPQAKNWTLLLLGHNEPAPSHQCTMKDEW